MVYTLYYTQIYIYTYICVYTYIIYIYTHIYNIYIYEIVVYIGNCGDIVILRILTVLCW